VHVPDGYINAATSLGAGAIALSGVSVALRRTGDWLDDRRVPLTGLVAAFIFAAQMLNFPVAAGTSGHLIGGVLAAVLVGPWAGALCLAVVIFVQALFADGGLSAIGLNVLNLSLIAGAGGYAVFLGIRRFLLPDRASLALASGAAAGISVLMSVAAFTVEFALGGVAHVSVNAVATAMFSVHALIAIAEGVITAATVALVMRVRPDLVHGAKDFTLVPRSAEPALADGR
jgi:cobalt/nickel transport system permease protein